MGVKGLLPCLRSITRPVPLERYRGLAVAVDAMSWLHKGIFAGDVRTLAKHQWNESDQANNNASTTCCRPTSRRLDFDTLAERYTYADRSRPTAAATTRESSKAALAAASKCIAYAMRHAETLRRDYGMDVVMVIDGGSLPSKSEIDRSRREERRQAFEDALAAEAKGDSRNARKLYARACSVTHQMRHELIQSCKRAGINFVVAPYEADAQMAQLAHSGAVDLVITEDSDLLAYGCPRVLFKIDFAAGRGEEIQLMRDLAANDDLSFRNWTHDMFVYMCIVNGCDYCEGVPGIGIKTAHKLVRMHRTPSKIFNALRLAGRMPPNDFEESFYRAYRTFRHQRVYNQESERVESLLPIDKTRVDGDTKTIWPFLGPFIDPDRAKAIATGVLHPVKKVPWDVALAESNVATNVRCEAMQDFTGRPDSRRLHQFGNQNENDPPGDHHRRHRPNVGKRADRNNMFKFFPSKKDSTGEDESSSPSHSVPPLQEIFVNGDKAPSSSVNGGIATDRGRAQPIPVHFNEYSSKLVGNFETLSRRSRGPSGSRNVSRAVQRLRASARARVEAHHQAADDGGRKEGGAEPLIPEAAVRATANSLNPEDHRKDQRTGTGDAYAHDENHALNNRFRSDDAVMAALNLSIENDVHYDAIAGRHDIEQQEEEEKEGHDAEYALNQSVDMYSNERVQNEDTEHQYSEASFRGAMDDISCLDGRCNGGLEYRREAIDAVLSEETSTHLEQPDEREFRRSKPVDMSLEFFEDDQFFPASSGLQTEFEGSMLPSIDNNTVAAFDSGGANYDCTDAGFDESMLPNYDQDTAAGSAHAWKDLDSHVDVNHGSGSEMPDQSSSTRGCYSSRTGIQAGKTHYPADLDSYDVSPRDVFHLQPGLETAQRSLAKDTANEAFPCAANHFSYKQQSLSPF